MSMCVYIAYVWFSDWWAESSIRYSVGITHDSALFWLTIILLGGTTYCGDVFIEWYRFTYYPNGSDKMREVLQTKLGGGWNDPYKQM